MFFIYLRIKGGLSSRKRLFILPCKVAVCHNIDICLIPQQFHNIPSMKEFHVMLFFLSTHITRCSMFVVGKVSMACVVWCIFLLFQLE